MARKANIKPRTAPVVAEKQSDEEAKGISPDGATAEEREARNVETQVKNHTDPATDETGMFNGDSVGIGAIETPHQDVKPNLAAEPNLGMAHSTNALEQPPIDRKQARAYPADVLPGVEKKTNVLVVNRSKLQKPAAKTEE